MWQRIAGSAFVVDRPRAIRSSGRRSRQPCRIGREHDPRLARREFVLKKNDSAKAGQQSSFAAVSAVGELQKWFGAAACLRNGWARFRRTHGIKMGQGPNHGARTRHQGQQRDRGNWSSHKFPLKIMVTRVRLLLPGPAPRQLSTRYWQQSTGLPPAILKVRSVARRAALSLACTAAVEPERLRCVRVDAVGPGLAVRASSATVEIAARIGISFWENILFRGPLAGRAGTFTSCSSRSDRWADRRP